jgi:hypothetical protein
MPLWRPSCLPCRRCWSDEHHGAGDARVAAQVQAIVAYLQQAYPDMCARPAALTAAPLGADISSTVTAIAAGCCYFTQRGDLLCACALDRQSRPSCATTVMRG